MLPSAVVQNTPRLDTSDSTVLWFGNHVLGRNVSAAPLSSSSGCGVGVHPLAISHNGSLSTELLSNIPRSSGHFCILPCLLTHSQFRPILLLSPLRILHATLIHHCLSQTLLSFLSCFVFPSCPCSAMASSFVVAHKLPIACSRFDQRRLHSAKRLAYCSTHHAGPIRRSRSCFEAPCPFPFPFPSDSTTNLYPFFIFPFSLSFPVPISGYDHAVCPHVPTVHTGDSIHCAASFHLTSFLLSDPHRPQPSPRPLVPSSSSLSNCLLFV